MAAIIKHVLYCYSIDGILDICFVSQSIHRVITIIIAQLGDKGENE